MLRRPLITYGWLEAEIHFWGINPLQITSFVRSVKEKPYVEPESYPRLVPSSFLPTCFAEWFDAALQLKFDGLFLMASIASGNRGGRYSMRDTLPDYDGITFLIDKNIDKALQDSKKELISILSDNSISQPIVILVPTQNASGYANDPELISEFELEDVIRKGNGRVSIFAYSLSPTQFIGCSEAVRWLLDRI